MQETARRQLEDVIFPFWLSQGIDGVHGGFYTCFDNRGRTLLSTDKFTWSQGRFVWLLARAARLAAGGLLSLDAAELTATATRGAEFLAEHAVRDDGTCHYVLTEKGAPAAPSPGQTHSTYADCFAAMGFAELARWTSDPGWLDLAGTILARASADVETGRAVTAPYPVPSGFTGFGPRMIVLNTTLEYVTARHELGVRGDGDLPALAAARTAMLRHRQADGSFQEMIPRDPEDASFIARHRVPGHAIEGIWMALDAGEFLGETADTADLLTSIDVLCRSAWDDHHGGLFRYVDAQGNTAPRGETTGTVYEELVGRTWDTKLWWVHSESAYTTALAAHRHGDEAAAEWFDRIWDYTLRTFPGGTDGEEWIQIRDRQGRPLDEVVALPVKDPFHVSRNLMQLLDLTG
ncbi:N-acylglucosamine 2-epimerase [Phytoactinopolyspora alkaliphila]|uniref:N-acylglucosamine 2-epimerase n=1 Tax=Phytoactinopolyspora alkaliphila TaxID=1783498 RepID=A0A6N9YFL3_9ACTN|nr:N-acylglucosamine 2-epimerase [Phytoactinopolyspora alkaliphila]